MTRYYYAVLLGQCQFHLTFTDSMKLISLGKRVLFFFLLSPSFLFAAEDMETITYKLSQSSGSYQFWTTPPTERVFKDDQVPTATGSGIKIYAARNEYEPFQLVIQPQTSGNVSVSMGSFGAGITTEIYQVKYVPVTQVSDNLGRTGDYPDPLWPLENNTSIALSAGENTSLWLTVHVPISTPDGDYSTNIQVDGIAIPVNLHVFNFAIPTELHVKSQMNFSHETILNAYGVGGTGTAYWSYVDKIKEFFIDHRLTPKSVLWSGGLTSSGGASYLNYNCDTHTITDPYGIWGFVEPSARYLDGTGMMNGTFTQPFNGGQGFPSFMGITFQNNDASADQRPSNFCGHIRSTDDWYQNDNPSSAYNTAWFQYMTATQQYLQSLGYLDKAYYYFANEPQNQAGYDAVAWYSRYLKEAAPNLKLMVSENPRPEIYNSTDYVSDGQIDIWLPVLNEYDPNVSQVRERDHGEESWIYFLHGTRPPYFNPITLDHPGIESKLTGWFLWKYRIRGIAYYSLNNWSTNPWADPLYSDHNGDRFMLYPPSENNAAIIYGANNHRFVPSIRFELMRDSLEDYEYLYVLNGNSGPEIDVESTADQQADKIVSSLTTYTRDGEFMYNLRRLIGLKNGGEISAIPDITPPSSHPRTEGQPGNYYINFQNPVGPPTAIPLTVDGHEYLKIGWNNYDKTLGYGWYGDMAHVMYQYLTSGPNELQKSILFDDWGRLKTFEFDLPNGTYEVTVSVGWQGKIYPRNMIEIEGVSFVDDEASSPYLVRTRTVQVSDKKLTMNMGIFDEYTMLNYLNIEASGQSSGDPVAQFYTNARQGTAPCTLTFYDSSLNSPISWQWDFDNNGTVDATSRNPSHTYSTPGSYTVRLRVTGANGGSDEVVRTNYIEVQEKNFSSTKIQWLLFMPAFLKQ
ncbi:glycoside hydrolase domain-containing protein [Desulfogranum japonicum]|uniref:glycoside hydrolase domain-containing protein n=1 Tax=Desulfogranum japonicum TaxID=231447 RepID=UPI00041675AC|nr:glycoside hydrolase domain-containing protein [Desulfogranum japonicum]